MDNASLGIIKNNLLNNKYDRVLIEAYNKSFSRPELYPNGDGIYVIVEKNGTAWISDYIEQNNYYESQFKDEVFVLAYFPCKPVPDYYFINALENDDNYSEIMDMCQTYNSVKADNVPDFECLLIDDFVDEFFPELIQKYNLEAIIEEVEAYMQDINSHILEIVAEIDNEIDLSNSLNENIGVDYVWYWRINRRFGKRNYRK